MAAPARSSQCRSLSPSWAHRASPTPRRCGARSCRTGSPRMSAPLRISAAPPGRRSATISRPASPRPAFTSRWSIGPQPPLGQALCRPGPALRHRDRPGTPLQAQGQGQSRGWGAGGRALDSGAIAAPALLRAGRTQRGNPGPARRGQQPPDARLGHEPAGPLRSVGPAGAGVAATLSLRIRRVEALSGQPRLPRRDRQALLQRAAPADPPGGRGADHHDDSRDFPPRQARRQPPPQLATAPPDHRRRTHAQFAPALSRLDTRAHPPRSRSSRPRRRRAGRGDFAVAAASRTGLPLLHRHPAPGQALRRRTGRCRLRPCAGARHPLLQLGRRDPEEPPRAYPRRHRGAAALDPREHPRPRLLPLRGGPMLIHPTVERLRALGLAAMADAFMELQNAPDAGELSREDWLGLLVDREATSRENKRLARRLREARLRQPAVVEDVDFRAHRGLDRALFRKLATCEWVREHHHLVMVGPTGIGKSWLACALGHKACREGFSVFYKRASRLFADLAQARGEGRLPRLMTALERIRLLIIDDWGPEPLNPDQRRDLLEIVDDRDDRGSLLITSQAPVNRWHEVIGDPTLADAILDRIIHRAHRIDLKGPSLRRRLVASESPAA